MSKYFIFGQVNQKRDKLIYDIAIKHSSMTGLMTKLNNHEILVHTSYGDKKIAIGIAHIEFDEQFLDELKKFCLKH